jgi:hypothetical protein
MSVTMNNPMVYRLGHTNPRIQTPYFAFVRQDNALDFMYSYMESGLFVLPIKEHGLVYSQEEVFPFWEWSNQVFPIGIIFVDYLKIPETDAGAITYMQHVQNIRGLYNLKNSF